MAKPKLTNPFKFGTDIWDPSHRFETSWLLPPWILFGIRALIVCFLAIPKDPALTSAVSLRFHSNLLHHRLGDYKPRGFKRQRCTTILLLLHLPWILGYLLLLRSRSNTYLLLRAPRRHSPPKSLPSSSASTPLPLLLNNHHLPLPRHDCFLVTAILPVHDHLRIMVQCLPTRPQFSIGTLRSPLHQNQSPTMDPPLLPHNPARMLPRISILDSRHRAFLRLQFPQPSA